MFYKLFEVIKIQGISWLYNFNYENRGYGYGRLSPSVVVNYYPTTISELSSMSVTH